MTVKPAEEMPLDVGQRCLGCKHLHSHGAGFECHMPIRHCHSKVVAKWRKEKSLLKGGERT